MHDHAPWMLIFAIYPVHDWSLNSVGFNICLQCFCNDFPVVMLLGPVLGGNDWHWKQNVWHLSQSIGQLEGKALHRKMFV